jgi:hypothetical protein
LSQKFLKLQQSGKSLVPRDPRQVRTVEGVPWERLAERYMLNRVVLNAILGVVTGAAFALYGLEHAAIWGLTTGLCSSHDARRVTRSDQSAPLPAAEADSRFRHPPRDVALIDTPKRHAYDLRRRLHQHRPGREAWP